jgi:hypothetical protein
MGEEACSSVYRAFLMCKCIRVGLRRGMIDVFNADIKRKFLLRWLS